MHKVFIVDDEWAIAKGLEKVIDWNGLSCHTVSFTSSVDAYESAILERPDILITDIKMPYMDGLELIGKLKAADVKFATIIISGFSEFEYARKGIELGVNAYIFKPVEQEELKSAVAHAIAQIEKQDSVLKELEKLKLYETANGEIKPESKPVISPMKIMAEKYNLIDNIKEYIDINFAENLSLPEISERFFLNPFYLSQLFKKKTGHTYISYLTEKRIEKAKELLSGQDVKIYEVCHSVGYENVKHFSKIFEKLVGVRPSSFKNPANRK
jgi:two-component system, response regulator YesN